MLIYATGFHAVTGALDRIDVVGPGGQTLRDAWADGPRTYLGMLAEGFPNMLTLDGAHNAASFCNIPRCIEQNVELVSDLVAHMHRSGVQSVQAEADAVAEWTEHVHQSAERMLLSKVDSWFMGINHNLGKTKRHFMLYAGGSPAYRERCD